MRGRARRVTGLMLGGAAILVMPSPAGVLSAPSGAAAASSVPLSECVDPDHGRPVLVESTVSPSVVDVRNKPATVTITARVKDTGGPGPASGLKTVTASTVVGAVSLEPSSADIWTSRVTIPRGVGPSQSVVGLELWDRARNYQAYRAGALNVLADRDTRGPVLRRLRLSTTHLDTRWQPAEARIWAHVTDNMAGTAKVTLSLSRPQPWSGGDYRVPLHLVEGSPANGWWRGALRMPRWQSDFTGLLGIGTLDAVNNVGGIIGAELRRVGPSRITVRSRTDLRKPAVRRPAVAPASVDVTESAGAVRFTVRASDAKSGVAHVDVSVGKLVALHLVSGNRRDGLWRARLPITRCTVAQSYHAIVIVTDRAGMTRGLGADPLTYTVANSDRVPPEVAGPSTQPPASGPVTVTFTEDVTGISSASAPVTEGRPVDADPYNPTQPIAGSWSCASSSASQVDCATGAVRRASWTPDQPLQSGIFYVVQFNPNHILDVTDFAGNPLTTGTSFSPAP